MIVVKDKPDARFFQMWENARTHELSGFYAPDFSW